MQNILHTYRKQIIITSLLVGLFVMVLHPATHAFTEHAVEHNHEQSEAPVPDNQSDDCIECVLSAGSALEKPASDFYQILSVSSHSILPDPKPEINRYQIGCLLRGPPLFII